MDANLAEKLLEKLKDEDPIESATSPLADILTNSALMKKLTAAMLSTLLEHTKADPVEELVWTHQMIVVAAMVGYRLCQLENEMRVN